MTTVTISMPESLKQFLESEVETKGYGNVSEYIRSLLRDAQSRNEDARLEALLLESLAVGSDVALTPTFWRELRSDATQLVAKHKRTKARAKK